MKFSKGRSIVLLIVTVVVIAALGLLSAFGVNINGKNKGSAKNIILGLDLRGGVSFTYKIKNDKYSKQQLNDTMKQLRDRVEAFSTETDVYQEGDDKITVDIPGVYDAKSVEEELSKPGSIMFVTTADASFEGDDTYKLYTTADGTRYTSKEASWPSSRATRIS